MRAFFFMALSGISAVAATDPQYAIQGRTWSEVDLRQAYERIRHLYAVTPTSRMIQPAGELKAYVLQGKLERRASDRRIIIKSDSGFYAVQCRAVIAGKPGAVVDVLVRESGTPNYSYEIARDDRRSIPQVVDVTLSFDEFVRSLQRGFHYPELPELGTQENRKGLFRTERVDMNTVEDR